MAINLVVNGTTYAYPQQGDTGWGPNATNWAQAVTNGMLQKAGGSFDLTAEVDFGSSHGLRSLYFRSKSANPSATGVLRLSNDEGVAWRNAANSGDILLKVDTNDELNFNGTKVLISGLIVNADVSASAAIAYSKLALTDSIVNADINSSAAIAYSKLNLASSIVNADVSGSAAIAYSKLALADSIVNADINSSAAIAYSKLSLTGSIVNGDISSSAAIAYSKLALTGSIVDADINASAAIAYSKLAALTADRALQSSSGGAVEASSVTSTELGYLSGVTSGIQTQLSALQNALPSGDDFLQLEELGADPSNPSAGSQRIFAKNDGKIYKVDSNGVVEEIGAGGGGASGIIYFEDRMTADISKFSLYENGTGASPTTGAGGSVSANLTKSLNTSTPIVGESSYRLSKGGGVDLRGQGAAVVTDVTLDQVAKGGEPITVQFRYKTSANYASGDVKLFYYLVGDNQLFALNGVDNRGVFGNDLNADSTGRGQFTASLNATSSTTSIRVIAHIATTSTQNYDIDFSLVTIGTASTLTAPIVSDWVPYTPAIGGAGTVSNVFFSYKRVGETLLIRGRFTCGTVASSPATVALPSGLTIKTNNSSREYVGTYITSAGTSNTNKMGPSIADNNTTVLNFGRSNYAIAQSPTALLNGNDIWTSSQNVHVLAELQIAEWADSTNIISQTQANFQNAYSNVSLGSSQSVANATDTKVEFGTVDDEVGGGYSTTSHDFTAPKSGTCKVSATIRFDTNGGGIRILRVYKNGSLFRDLDVLSTTSSSSGATVQGDTEVPVEKGDTIDIRARQTSGSALSIGVDTNDGNYATFRMMEDLSVIGLAGQKYEVVENEFSSDLTATPAPNVSYGTWYSPSSSFTIALTPGTWQIELQGSVGSPTNSAAVGNQITIETGLATNTSAGNGIVETFRTHHFCYATNNMSYERVNQTFKPVTITSSTNYYIHVRANNFSGSPTLNSIGYRVNSFSNLRLRARRLR